MDKIPHSVLTFANRFGLPIGSAFAAAVILDNVIALDCLFKEIILASAEEDTKSSVGSYIYHSDQYPVLYVFIRAILALSLCGILVKTPRILLFIWIIAAVAVDSLRHGNLKMMFDALASFNLYLLVFMPIIRIYLYLIFIEVARVIEKQQEPRLLVGSYDGADEDLESLVPIGYDTVGIWKYYSRFHVLGTRILLTVDLVWTIVVLPALKAALGGFGCFIVVLIGIGLDVYALASIFQRQPSGVVIWRLLHLIFMIIILVIFGIEFMSTRREPSEQGTISTLTLAVILIYKVFLFWFSSGIEHSMEPLDFRSTNADHQIAQLEAGEGASEEGYQVTDGSWSAAQLSPMSGRVIITELEGRDSRGGWENRSGRASRASRITWGSQPGLGLTGSRERVDSRTGWGGSQSAVSDSRGEDPAIGRAGWDDSQSARSSREAISTSSISGWTTADSRSDMR